MRKYIMLAIAGYVWKKVQSRYLNKGRGKSRVKA